PRAQRDGLAKLGPRWRWDERRSDQEREMFEVRNLSAAYGQSQVLHGIDLSVARGEIVALVGRNGMGKSTLMKSLIGGMPAGSGQITVDGVNVTALPSHRRVANGLVDVPQ